MSSENREEEMTVVRGEERRERREERGERREEREEERRGENSAPSLLRFLINLLAENIVDITTSLCL